MNQAAARGDASDAKRARHRVIRLALLTLACISIGAAGGYAMHQVLPETYSATTSVLVLPTGGDISSTTSAGDVQIETEAQLVTSAQAADTASDLLKGRLTPAEILDGASVEVPVNSQVLQITVHASSPTLTRDASLALSNAYLTHRKARASTLINDQIKVLEERISGLSAALTKNSQDLGAARSAPQVALFESQRGLLVDQIADAQARLSELRSQSTSGGEIITEAIAPATPSSAPRLFTVVAGGVAGAVLAILLISAWEALVVRPRRGAGITARYPVLGSVGMSGVDGIEPAALRRSLARLCTAVRDKYVEPGPLVLITVGDSTLLTRFALRFAGAWAEMTAAERTVLVVAVPGVAPSLPGTTSAGAGFFDLLSGHATALDGVVETGQPQLSILGPGAYAASPSAEVARTQVLRAWMQLEREYHQVIVTTDSPVGTGSAQIALTAGHILVLTEPRLARSRQVVSTLDELEWLGLSSRLGGLVFVGQDGVQSGSGGRQRGSAAAAAPSNGGAVNSPERGQTSAADRGTSR